MSYRITIYQHDHDYDFIEPTWELVCAELTCELGGERVRWEVHTDGCTADYDTIPNYMGEPDVLPEIREHQRLILVLPYDPTTCNAAEHPYAVIEHA